MLADLHIHTTCSDGIMSPGQIVEQALSLGLDWIAITDHDTLDGTAPALLAARGKGIRVLRGVEISTGISGRIHVLCYWKPSAEANLRAFLAGIQQQRRQRALAILARLRQLGIPVSDGELPQDPKVSVGRPTIARILVAKGVVENVEEAFLRLLESGKPAYVPLPQPETDEVIEKVRSWGAVPVLAHPQLMKITPDELRERLQLYKARGLMGLEVYHPSQRGFFQEYRSLADSFGLFATGGSDYHGGTSHNDPLGGIAAEWPDPQNTILTLDSLTNREET